MTKTTAVAPALEILVVLVDKVGIVPPNVLPVAVDQTNTAKVALDASLAAADIHNEDVAIKRRL
jgi:hypothetical protein